MVKVVNDLLTSTDSGRVSVLLSLDISAAFDTLDHGRLLQRATDIVWSEVYFSPSYEYRVTKPEFTVY